MGLLTIKQTLFASQLTLVREISNLLLVCWATVA